MKIPIFSLTILSSFPLHAASLPKALPAFLSLPSIPLCLHFCLHLSAPHRLTFLSLLLLSSLSSLLSFLSSLFSPLSSLPPSFFSPLSSLPRSLSPHITFSSRWDSWAAITLSTLRKMPLLTRRRNRQTGNRHGVLCTRTRINQLFRRSPRPCDRLLPLGWARDNDVFVDKNTGTVLS